MGDKRLYNAELINTNRVCLNLDGLSILDTRDQFLEVFLRQPKKDTQKTVRLLTQSGLTGQINILGEDDISSGSYQLQPGTGGSASVTFTWSEYDGWTVLTGFSDSFFPTKIVDELPSSVCNAISSDGTLIVLGNPGKTDVYGQCGNRWKPLQSLTGFSVGFGASVAMSSSGRWIAIGDPTNGIVYIFSSNQCVSSWYLVQPICAPPSTDTYITTLFGFSLDFDAPGETLAVGAPGTSSSLAGGSIWIYKRSGCTFCSYVNNPLLSSFKFPGNLFGSVFALNANAGILVTIISLGELEIFALTPDEPSSYKLLPKSQTTSTPGTLGTSVSISDYGDLLSYKVGTSVGTGIVTEFLDPITGNITALLSSVSNIEPLSLCLSGDGKTLLSVNQVKSELVLQTYTLTHPILPYTAYFYTGFTPTGSPISTGIKTTNLTSIKVSLNPSGNRGVLSTNVGKTLILG